MNSSPQAGAPAEDGAAASAVDELAPPAIALALSGTPLLQGMTVIITGATGGIGRHLSRLLAASGARLGLVDLDEQTVQGLVAELSGSGGVAVGAGFDASDADHFRAFQRRVGTELGAVEGLVNCAGLWQPRPFGEVSRAEWELLLTANVTTAFVACQVVLPDMITRKRGAIVNFASTAGEYGSITPAAHYAAAKGAVIGLTKSLAREASPHNVRVNAISPGPTDTVALGAASPEQKAAAGARTLFNRLGQPDEVAAGCVYLLSSLSTFVTGHILRVNGGALL